MTSADLSVGLYDQIRQANVRRVYKSWHGSSMSDCPRAHYFKRLGIAPVTLPTAAKILRWSFGHVIEAEIRPHLLALYPHLTSNQRLYSKQLDLTGEYDNYDPDSKRLIEVKSVGPRAVKYKRVGETRYHLRDEAPYLAHEWQQHSYVLLLNEIGIEVESITYLYISLEGLLVPYTGKVKPDMLKAVTERLRALNVAWTTKTPPDCICDKEHEMWGSSLQFCDFRTKENCCDLKLIEEVK